MSERENSKKNGVFDSPTRSVDRVLLKAKIKDIISYLLEKNRILLVDDLFRRASRELDAPNLIIDDIIDDLIHERFIVPGTRISREIILNNQNRRKIYLLVGKYPGININTIKKKLDLGTNPVLWHLDVLLKFGCIQEVKYKNSALFGRAQLDPKEMLLHFLYRRELIKNIIFALISSPRTISGIAEDFCIPKQKISYNIDILRKLDFLTKRPHDTSGKKKIIAVTDSLVELLPRVEQHYQ